MWSALFPLGVYQVSLNDCTPSVLYECPCISANPLICPPLVGCINHRQQLELQGKCPVCSAHYLVSMGNQPEGGTMQVQVQPYSLAGHPHVGTIVITYNIPSGVQGAGHPHPGVPFSGTHRIAYLPDNAEGKQVLSLLKVCFERRHTFSVGRSLTTGMDNVITWGTVHHKTNTSGGKGNAVKIL